ncbi:MAG: hypothetical protein IBX64_05565 [Actinobacteria bacterium]|nr:hypothetical protein [Actinomycetota bacterium]
MKYSLPTNEVSAQNQLALVKIYVQKSNHGKRAVRIDEIKALSPVKSDRISKCHRFLVDLGLLIKEGHRYRPSKNAIKISGHFADGSDSTAQEDLRALVAGSWFGRFVEEFLKLVGSASRESLVERLLIAAKMPDIDLNRRKAGVLIDWLLTANFIQKDSNDSFFLNETPFLPDNKHLSSSELTGTGVSSAGEHGARLNLTIEVSLSELDPELRSEIMNLIKQKLV